MNVVHDPYFTLSECVQIFGMLLILLAICNPSWLKEKWLAWRKRH